MKSELLCLDNYTPEEDHQLAADHVFSFFCIQAHFLNDKINPADLPKQSESRSHEVVRPVGAFESSRLSPVHALTASPHRVALNAP